MERKSDMLDTWVAPLTLLSNAKLWSFHNLLEILHYDMFAAQLRNAFQALCGLNYMPPSPASFNVEP